MSLSETFSQIVLSIISIRDYLGGKVKEMAHTAGLRGRPSSMQRKV